MNTRIIITAVMILTMSFGAFAQEDFTELWKKADGLKKKGLPQSALEVTEDIQTLAREKGDDKNLLKALLYNNTLRAEYQENFLGKSINEFMSEIEKTDSPATQIMHSIVADLYWRYYLANRGAILDRTGLTGGPGNGDFTEWGLNRLVDEVMHHYSASLEEAEMLKSIPVREYSLILETQEGSEKYRPTLYDFLAHRAIDFYLNEERSVASPAEGFELEDPAWFSMAGEFTGLSIPGDDPGSFTYRALEIFRDLLSFHLGDDDPAPLIDADLKRLQFVRNNYIGADKDKHYAATLKKLNEWYKKDEAGTLVSFELASLYVRKGNQYDPFQQEEFRWHLKEAKEVIDDAVKRHPASRGAENCKTLLPLIEKVETNITVPYANLPGKPLLAALEFRNLEKVYFRLIKMDAETDRQLRYRQREADLLNEYLKYDALREFSVKLPDEGDYQAHVAEISMDELDPGYYVLLAGRDEDFRETRIVKYNHFWVTNLSYITRNAPGGTEIFVLDRDSGEPVEGVRLESFSREYDYGSRTYSMIPAGETTTGPEGHAMLESNANRSRSVYVRFSKGADTFMTDNFFFISSPAREQQVKERTHFFTDRAIYRPGQTVKFKGIMIESLKNKHEVIANRSTTVTLFDRNGKEIEKLSLVTSEYGSFSGSFTLPESLLTGMLRISNKNGSTYITVEEYKRPTFRVEIEPLQGSYKLGEEVSVTGNAETYSGSPVDNAQVKYRVVRKPGFPFRRAWWFWPIPGGEEVEITNGVATTGSDGKFSFSFRAIPDHKVDKKYKPVFYYTIYADVTDINGETHTTEETVTVGYQSLMIETEVAKHIPVEEPPEVTVKAENLNGEEVEATINAGLFRLESPGRTLRSREWSRPDVFIIERDEFIEKFPMDVYANEDEISEWERAEKVYATELAVPSDSVISPEAFSGLEEGAYVLLLESTDEYGEKVEVEKYFTIYSRESLKMPVKSTDLFIPGKERALPGETVTLYAGTSEKDVKMLLEQKKGPETVKREWITVSDEIRKFEIDVDESLRGGFAIEISWVSSNRSYQHKHPVAVPFTNKELDISFETFRSELVPGGREEWKIRLAGEGDEPAVAELLASMYDASLDAFRDHNWMFNLYSATSQYTLWDVGNAFAYSSSTGFGYPGQPGVKPVQMQQYDKLDWFGFKYYRYSRSGRHVMDRAMLSEMKSAAPGMASKGQGTEEEPMDAGGEEEAAGDEVTGGPPEKDRDESPDIPLRRNFEETAFFYPGLLSGEDGAVALSFTVPESLTEWRFMALAHDKALRTGYLEKTLVTRKEVMVVPNYPRYFREGDRMIFSVKIISLSEEELTGEAGLEFHDAITGDKLDDIPGFETEEMDFTVSAGNSTVVSWPLEVPYGHEAVTVRVRAAAGTHSDGEEKTLPVLPNRMMVTETLPMPVRGISDTEFTFEKVKDMQDSKTLSPYRLTVEFTPNPAWYAVMALPYLMEPNYRSADAIFNRYYSNALASHIANSDPRIRNVFEMWKQEGEESFYSQLEKNEELKGILLNATPWVLDATSERESMKRIAVLFDENRMEYEKTQALQKLAELQTSNGGWSWFRGMPGSRHMTQQIVAGTGKLNSLGVIDLRSEPRLSSMMNRAFSFLDSEIREEYREIERRYEESLDEDHLSSLAIHYLYARSFFPDLTGRSGAASDAIGYFMEQAEKHWVEKGRFEQGLLALVMHRNGKAETASSIVKSLREHALEDEELGMYWRSGAGYMWNEAPVETQALMIEVFEEVASDSEDVEDMKVWLLKQKQTTSWHTNRSTAEAVYALLLRGSELLSDDEPVTLTVGRKEIRPGEDEMVKEQAGTGYFRKAWGSGDIKPAMGNLTVEKKTEGIAWGAAYFQYFEDLDKIESAGSPLSLEKKLFREINTPSGPELEEITADTPAETGDRIISRIIITADRNLQYVHLRDMRASSFEPVNTLSGYRYQGGLGYYESPKDASTDFFIQYMRKGKYVLEYPVFATQEGEFSNGITTVQCLYAPEFSAHSEGVRVVVR